MERIKEPAVANAFYSGDGETLKKQLESYNSNNIYEYKTRAVIVPHAGLVYSGELAHNGINQLDKNIKNIFVFAPAHRVAFDGIALSGFDKWKTPLGNIEVNQDINKELIERFNAKIFDEAYKEEHSVEIQIPIIQNIFDNVKIIPVLIGDESPKKISDIISNYYPNADCGFIISSDLSHFLTDEKAKTIDDKTAKMIESGNLKGFSFEQACGAIGIYGLVNFSNLNNFSLIRIGMHNSSKTSNDKSRVVGYGSWMLYEGTKNSFLKKYYSSFIMDLCKNVISARFNNKEITTNHPAVFNEYGACFVTLKKFGNLRGCIGSIIAHQPLINDLIQHSLDSAFKDSRFNPLEESEVDNLAINVSLLSEPKPISFKDEEDLLNRIVPYKDGIIIKDNGLQAVYLPSVWEDLPDKELFLKSLKMKAGMNPEHFSSTFEAYRYEAEYIES